jgi:hypothetical protein
MSAAWIGCDSDEPDDPLPDGAERPAATNGMSSPSRPARSTLVVIVSRLCGLVACHHCFCAPR